MVIDLLSQVYMSIRIANLDNMLDNRKAGDSDVGIPGFLLRIRLVVDISHSHDDHNVRFMLFHDAGTSETDDVRAFFRRFWRRIPAGRPRIGKRYSE